MRHFRSQHNDDPDATEIWDFEIAVEERIFFKRHRELDWSLYKQSFTSVNKEASLGNHSSNETAESAIINAGVMNHIQYRLHNKPWPEIGTVTSTHHLNPESFIS